MLQGKAMFKVLLCEILHVYIEVICKLEEQILLTLRYRYIKNEGDRYIKNEGLTIKGVRICNYVHGDVSKKILFSLKEQ